MRKNLIKRGDEHLRYEIREIAEVANSFARLGIPMVLENIGDPVAKGERLPDWMKEIVRDAVLEDRTYAYSATKGELEARQFVLRWFSDDRICTEDDIIFFNGLGDAINKVFANLPSDARVIGPNPTYPSHATAEAMHHGGHHVTYPLLLDQGGRIDVEALEEAVKADPGIVGILVINPNNPLGVVHRRDDLEAVVDIARRYDCFLLFDEIYQHLVFDASKIVRLSEIIGDVPGMSMKGVSKEIPWPGSRCGWIEVYNGNNDENFRDYINTLVISKMLEVCSTTLPQVAFPRIVSHAEFKPFMQTRLDKYRRRAETALETFAGSAVLKPVPPDGVFYLTVVFDTEGFPETAPLESRSPEARAHLEKLLSAESLRVDKQFAYELMAAEGICVVPLSGFSSPFDGFRMTLLEQDDDVFADTCRRIRKAADAYFTKAR